MPDPQQQPKVVSVLGVGTIAFPASMADADINSHIQDYMMRTGKGMIEQAQNQGPANARALLQNATPPDRSEAPGVAAGIYRNTIGAGKGLYHAVADPMAADEQASVAAEKGLSGMAGGQYMPDAIAKVIHRLMLAPAAQTAQEGSQYMQQAGKEFQQGNYGRGLGMGASGATNYALSAIPMAGPWINSIAKRAESGDVSGAATDVGMGILAEHAPKIVRGAASEVLDEGFTKRTAMADRATHAARIQEHVTNLANTVHDEAQQAMGSVSQKVDAANPNGVFPKDELRSAVKDAIGETVKIDEKLPPSIAKLLKEDKTKPVDAPIIGGKALDLKNPTDMQAYQNMKAQGVFSPEEIERFEGRGETPTWTFEQLKQFRSDLGRELGAFDKRGAVGAAANDVYGLLSERLRGAAEKAGAGGEWLDANAKYKNYVNDFVKSPLKKIVTAKTPTDVLSTLSGKNELIDSIMEKYRSYESSPEAMKAEAKRVGMNTSTNRMTRPSRWDLTFPAMLPLRVGARMVLRNPSVLDFLSGKGLPEGSPTMFNKIAAKKVSLTKP